MEKLYYNIGVREKKPTGCWPYKMEDNMTEEIRIVKFVRVAGFDNDDYFAYNVTDRNRWMEIQKERDKNKALLKKMGGLVYNDPTLKENENGNYVVVGDDLERILSLARTELQIERETRQKEAEENREKNRKLAQASYDIFAADKEEERCMKERNGG